MAVAPDDNARIFVSIASYRDPDCKNTVSDLFAKASRAQRLTVAVCQQLVPGEDDDCLLTEQSALHGAQLRVLTVHARDSKGACWARSEVQTLFDDQAYFLQVDSHMRFVPGWDERLIGMLAQCDAAKPILTTYPLAFTPPATFADDAIVTIHPKSFGAGGILAQGSTMAPVKDAPSRPQPCALLGAGLVFARGALVREVPYDPLLYFEGEEISLAVRSWTHGWDLFTPNQVIAWHDYGKRPERARHWKDQTDWGQLNRRAVERVSHLLCGAAFTDAQHAHQIAHYQLGTARTLAQYEAWSGLDFTAHLYKGAPLAAPETAADQPAECCARAQTFTSIWTNNGWRCAETRSGNGSRLAETVALRRWLPQTLQFLDCHIVADVGCGDLNWMQELTPQLRLYFGYDIVAGLIREVRQRYGDRHNCFFTELDMVTKTLPLCDAIVCRDSLTHLPLDATLMALRRFRQSGARYLIATTHENGRNRWVSSGAWFQIDLCAAPFNLPAPRLVLHEGAGKQLGVWACSELPQ